MAGESLELAVSLGQGGEGDRERLEPLCQAAEEELKGRLKEGVTAADCGGAFPLAAAWLALSDLAAAGAAGGVRKFSAGDVSVTESGAGAAGGADTLRQQAERVLAPYLMDEGFVFRGVRG